MTEQFQAKVDWLRCPPVRRQNADAGAATYGAGGLSAFLPEVQIYLCGPVPKRKKRRNENARRLRRSAVTADNAVLCCVVY